MGNLGSQTLTGKYFINQLAARAGRAPLMWGQILGPLESELSPYYLCDLYPTTTTEVAITVQTVLTLDQLAGVYLYTEKDAQAAEWDRLQREMQAARERREQEKGSAEDAEDAPTPRAAPRMVMVGGGAMPAELAEALGLRSTTIENLPDEDAESSSPTAVECDCPGCRAARGEGPSDDWYDDDDDDDGDTDDTTG